MEKSRTRGVLRAKGGWEKSRTTRLLHVFHVRSGDFLSSLFFFFFFSFVPFFLYFPKMLASFSSKKEKAFSVGTQHFPVCVCVCQRRQVPYLRVVLSPAGGAQALSPLHLAPHTH